MPQAPEAGDKAPNFDLETDRGRVALSQMQGKAVVLYFYPKDDTSGCTNEAIAFTAALADFEAAGATIVGVSKDSAASHGKFRKKHELSIELGADTDGSVTEAYGVWVQKSLYGRTYMGIERATFLIDANGFVRKVWHKVKVAGHVNQVLEAVRGLAKE